MRTAVETEAVNLHPIVKISDQELYFTTIKHMQHKLSTESEDFNSTKKKKKKCRSRHREPPRPKSAIVLQIGTDEA